MGEVKWIDGVLEGREDVMELVKERPHFQTPKFKIRVGNRVRIRDSESVTGRGVLKDIMKGGVGVVDCVDDDRGRVLINYVNSKPRHATPMTKPGVGRVWVSVKEVEIVSRKEQPPVEESVKELLRREMAMETARRWRERNPGRRSRRRECECECDDEFQQDRPIISKVEEVLIEDDEEMFEEFLHELSSPSEGTIQELKGEAEGIF